MKLNEAGKNEVRKLIEEQVKKIPDGQRLKLKKEILEDLIFYTVHYRGFFRKFKYFIIAVMYPTLILD